MHIKIFLFPNTIYKLLTLMVGELIVLIMNFQKIKINELKRHPEAPTIRVKCRVLPIKLFKNRILGYHPKIAVPIGSNTFKRGKAIKT